MVEKLKVVSASVLVTVPVKGKKKGYEIKNEPVEIEPADEYKVRRLIEGGCLREASTVPARRRNFEAPARRPVSRKATPRKATPRKTAKKGTRKGRR